MNENNFSFVVDLSKTMIVSNISSSKTDKQKLYCKCGHHQTYSQKIKRNIVKNYDELTEDKSSVSSVICDNCGEVYDSNNKIFLINPNTEELYNIDYKLKYDTEKSIYNLERYKYVVFYSEEKDEIKKIIIKENLSIDLDKKNITLEIKKPFLNLENISSNFKEIDVDGDKKEFIIDLDITNLSLLEEFFNFKDVINFNGLNVLVELFEKLKEHVKDLEKLNNMFFLDFVNSNNLYFQSDENNNLFIFSYVDSGFGDGEKLKKKIFIGDFLNNISNAYKILFSFFTFEYSSTILMTKNYSFFEKWIESKFIKKPNLYLKNESTNPASIIETSINDSREIKISNTIYNSLTRVYDLEVLIENHKQNKVKKNELENLLQNYDSKRVFNLVSKICNLKDRNENINLDIKHIEHIIKNNIDKENKSDFMTVYLDTIRVIDLLDLKDKIIFKTKSYSDLSTLHDDYTARYNAIKDLKKAELYKKAVEPFIKYNTVIGDVEFLVVDSTEKLNLEGLKMNHCIYTYLNRICDKQYIAINVNHLISKEKATAGFIRKGDKIELEQLKGFYNSRATRELINATIEFCKKNKFNINVFGSDITPDENRQRAMPSQMTEEELLSYREKKNKKKDN